tara:strand:+ start:378 stop:563 length:186 start_codon:yes stop_codon:yes gene_type:complete
MWKIFNKLFGWQYALIPFAGGTELVRVHTTQTGIKYYKIYGDIRILRESAIWMTLNKKEEV